jgi:hypothetical protein
MLKLMVCMTIVLFISVLSKTIDLVSEMCQTIPGQLTRLTVPPIVPLSSPWTSFVGRSLIIGYCASFCILFHSAAIIIYSLCSSMIRFYNVQFFFQLFLNSDLILFFFLCSVKSFSSNACFNYFQFRRIVRSLVDYCSIIVQYSDPGRKFFPCILILFQVNNVYIANQ